MKERNDGWHEGCNAATAMNQAQNIIPRLRQLAELEKTQRQRKDSRSAGKALAAEIESLRELLPTSILAHHDSFKVRGKLTIAPVVRGDRPQPLAGGRVVVLVVGLAAALRRVADDLSVCANCGVFIYLGDEPQADESSARTRAGTRKAKPSERAVRNPASEIQKSLRSGHPAAS